MATFDTPPTPGVGFPKKLTGTGANETFSGGSGDDSIDGGAGVDTAVYSGARSSYTVTATSTGYTISGPDGSDTLTGIERLQFSNQVLALDISGNAGQAYRLYKAAFDRTPDNTGLKFWIGVIDGGMSLNDVAAYFISSGEFKDLYGANPTTDQFVTKLYANVLHRPYDQGGFDWWTGLLNTNQLTKAQVLAYFAASAENDVAVVGVQAGIDLFI